MISVKKKFTLATADKEIQKIQDAVLDSKLPAGFSDVIIYMLSELYANVHEHSKAKNTVIAISVQKGEMNLSVRDDGIGIRMSYLRNNNFAKDDKSAILLALSGVSTKKRNERAFGLYSIKQLTEKQNGTMKITSGVSSVTITKAKMEFSESRKRHKGVSVQIKMSVKPMNIYEIIR